MNIQKKKLIVVISIMTAIFLIGLVGVYWHNHPTHYLYNDSWIIGKNALEIEERYGTFEYDSKTIYDTLVKGYCVKPYTTDYLFGEPVWPEYYMIYFDKNGKAYKVEKVVGGWGG